MKKLPNLNTYSVNAEEIVIPAAGEIAAILYHRMNYWCVEHAHSGSVKYRQDERWWQWDSYGEMQKIYPYWSKRQLRHAIEKLETVGLIKVKRSKNFKGSNKYSAVSLDEWMMSDKFQEQPKNTRKQVTQVIERRKLDSKGPSRYCAKNGTPYAKYGIPYANDGIPIYLIDTLIRNLDSGTPENSDDISDLELLRIQRDSLKIDEERARIMYDHFETYMKHQKTIVDDEVALVNRAYRSDSCGKSYPFWVRLVYGEANGLMDQDVRDVIAPRVVKELDANPYVMHLLLGYLKNYPWNDMGIKPDEYLAAWNKINNKVEFTLNNAESKGTR